MNADAAANQLKTYRIYGSLDLDFEMYCAGEGHEGGGKLIFMDGVVRAIPEPESAWRTATRDNRGAGQKIRDDYGNWSVWFLLARALVLSRESLDEAEREITPANSEGQATVHLARAGKARALARDARTHAVLYAATMSVEIPIEVAANDKDFIDWFGIYFGSASVDPISRGDFTLVFMLKGYVDAANRLPTSGYPDDVIEFCRVLAKAAHAQHGPPTKASVRLALGAEKERLANLQRKNRSAAADKRATAATGQREVGRNSRYTGERSIWADTLHEVSKAAPPAEFDLVDMNTFNRLLKRTGFQWLPNGKPGPKRQKSAGTGRLEALAEPDSAHEPPAQKAIRRNDD